MIMPDFTSNDIAAEQRMAPWVIGLCYVIFILSGAAALIYQVAWVRSLTLIFGGTHLAITAVLSIFMAGLALGGHIIGKIADSVDRPLRVYGFLEIGIALFALIFLWLREIYSPIYIYLAQGKDESQLYLFLIRAVFSVVALIIPTTFMGGTLPLLTQFLSRQPYSVRKYLSFLYSFNTIGSVIGAVVAGFFLLRYYSVSLAIYTAIAVNILVGIASILLQSKLTTAQVRSTGAQPEPDSPKQRIKAAGAGVSGTFASAAGASEGVPPETVPESGRFMKMILWGIGISGFCALGYEVLWSRLLSLIVGASVYGFTVMLAAFLSGIALGSGAYGIFSKSFRKNASWTHTSVLSFGIVQIFIGLSALVVSASIKSLPSHIVHLQSFFRDAGLSIFGVSAWASFVLAFIYMFVPAFFMGLAFPLAGRVHAEHKNRVGSAVGDILAYNTVGAIIGAAVSGFLLVRFLGIERSLQILILINVGLGFFLICSARSLKSWNLLAAGLTAASVMFLIIDHDHARMWDKNYFGIYASTSPQDFDTPEKIQQALANIDILYYGEGVESIISSFKVHGDQFFVTNGRTEASTGLQDQICQYTLGHLPMLLHRNPEDVLVIGLGSGMTAGATSVHPGVKSVTLVEIEPKVIGAAKTFQEYNHHVLDNPNLRILFNDGRNFLTTSTQKYDVITADPIHPWFRGAGYLYTSEYFKLVAEHLKPGGVACQWVPLYELTPQDIKSIIGTFSGHFRYTMLWVTFADAELIGSNDPLIIDEAGIERRITHPPVQADLRRLGMGSAKDFLSFFVMGSEGMTKLETDSIVNTDDNLYLEFSAPLSYGTGTMTIGPNLREILKQRENIISYFSPAGDHQILERQQSEWSAYEAAAQLSDIALIGFVEGYGGTPQFANLMVKLSNSYPWYAPAKFLRQQYAFTQSRSLSLSPR